MKNIQVNANVLLWLLTGRSKFVADALNVGASFIADPTSPEITAVRRLMRFDDTSTDAYVIPPHSAMLAQRPLLNGLPGVDQSLSFLRQIEPESNSVQRASPISYQGKPYTIDGSVAAEKGFSVVVTTREGNRAKVELDGTLVGRFPFEFSTGSRLVVEKLKDYGVPPAAVVDSWVEGSSFFYRVVPRPYPYALFADKLQNSSEAIKLMSEGGTLEAFSESISPVEKVGAACVAICKARKKELYNQQIALEVQSDFVSGVVLVSPAYLTSDAC